MSRIVFLSRVTETVHKWLTRNLRDSFHPLPPPPLTTNCHAATVAQYKKAEF
jgi:hypothetical protein